MKDLAPKATLETLSPEYNAGRLGEIVLRNLSRLDEIDLGVDMEEFFTQI